MRPRPITRRDGRALKPDLMSGFAFRLARYARRFQPRNWYNWRWPIGDRAARFEGSSPSAFGCIEINSVRAAPRCFHGTFASRGHFEIFCL